MPVQNWTLNMKFLLTTFFTCFSLLIFAQFDTSSRDPEALENFRSGEKLLAAKDFTEARNFFRKATKADPNYVDAFNRLAETYRLMEIVDSTIYYYKASLDIYPRGLDAHQSLAAAYQIKGDFEAAINQYRELLRHYKDYPQAYYGMALVHFNQREFPETIRASEAAMQIFMRGKSLVNAADARMLAGQAYMNLGEYNKALQYFKASKKYFSDKPYYYYYMGFCYLRLDKKEKAHENFNQAKRMGYKIPVNVTEELRQ